MLFGRCASKTDCASSMALRTCSTRSRPSSGSSNVGAGGPPSTVHGCPREGILTEQGGPVACLRPRSRGGTSGLPTSCCRRRSTLPFLTGLTVPRHAKRASLSGLAARKSPHPAFSIDQPAFASCCQAVARRISGTSTIRVASAGGVSTARTSAAIIAPLVTRPNRSAVSRFVGNQRRTPYTGTRRYGHR